MAVSTARCVMLPSKWTIHNKDSMGTVLVLHSYILEYLFTLSLTILRQFCQQLLSMIFNVESIYSSEKYERLENTCRKMFLHIVLYCGHLRGGFCLMQRTNVASRRSSQNKLMLVPCRRPATFVFQQEAEPWVKYFPGMGPRTDPVMSTWRLGTQASSRQLTPRKIAQGTKSYPGSDALSFKVRGWCVL